MDLYDDKNAAEKQEQPDPDFKTKGLISHE